MPLQLDTLLAPLPGRSTACIGRWSVDAVNRLDATTFVALLCAIAMAPLELSAPWASVAGLRLTNVELAWVIALTLVGVTWCARLGVASAAQVSEPWGRLQLSPLAWAWVGVVVTLSASALQAPLNAVEAAKCVARLAAAGAVAAATASMLTTDARRVLALGVVVGLGAVVAAAAWLEAAQTPWALETLKAFRPGIHVVGGQIRAGGTLQYPTIASMHLELAFALGVGLLLTLVDRSRFRAAGLAFIALCAIGWGIALSFTRAGLLTTLACLGLVAAVRMTRSGFDAGARALGALAVVLLMLVALHYSSEQLWLRLTTESQAGWYRADYRVPAQLVLRPRGIRKVPVDVTNTGRLSWDSTADPPFFMSYHWLEQDADRVVHYDGLRSPFGRRIGPGDTARLDVWVEAPPEPGRYRLAWDVVQEQRLWFSTEGVASALTPVVVEGRPEPPMATARPTLPRASVRPGRFALWRTALGLTWDYPLFGVGPDNFRWLFAERTGTPNYDTRVHANSLYLEWLVGGGLIGVAASVHWLYRLAAIARRVLARRGGQASLALGTCAALVAFFAHGLVDSFVTFTPIYVMVGVTVGMLLSLDAAQPEAHADRI